MSPLASGYVKEGRRIGSFSPKVILLWHNILFRQKTFFAQIFCYVNQVQVMTCQSDSFFHQITKPQKNYIYVYSGQKAGIEKGGATPTSISIFDSYYMKTLWFKFGHYIFSGFKMPLKLGCQFFSLFIKWNWRPLSLKYWHFEAP